MKKTLTLIILYFCSLISFSQNCINVNWAYFDNPSGDNTNWKLYINWNASGTKHLNTIVKRNDTTILTQCHESSPGQSSGTLIYNFISPNTNLSSLSAYLVRFTGTCGNGTQCDLTLTLLNNILPIKISNLFAKNVNNITEIYFKIESISDRIFTLNFTTQSGRTKKHKIVFPPYAESGQNWVIYFNNIDGSYNLKKL